MPIFPGERPLTLEERSSGEFAHSALSHFQEQTRLRPEQASFSVVQVAWQGQQVILNFIARPFLSVLGPTQQRRPDPDRWWIFDADVDESEVWRAQAIIGGEGTLIAPDGTPLGGGFVVTLGRNDDEGDTLGTPAPRPRPIAPDETRRQAILQNGGLFRGQQQRAPQPRAAGDRLPQGNSSVRDAVRRMRDLDVKDATFEEDDSLDGMMLGPQGFLAPTGSPAYVPAEPGQPEPDPTMADVQGYDITGQPLVARPKPPGSKTVYDHLNDNLRDLRAARPAPSVWDRLAAQRKSK